MSGWIKRPEQDSLSAREWSLKEVPVVDHLKLEKSLAPWGLLVVAFGTKAQVFEWTRATSLDVTAKLDRAIFDISDDDERARFREYFLSVIRDLQDVGPS